VKRVGTYLREGWEIVRDAAYDYSRDHASHLSAAIAFYAIFAVAPLILIATAVGGLVWGPEVARAELLGQLDVVFGSEARSYVDRLLQNWQESTSGWLATLIGTVTTLYLAFRLFDALRDMLDTVWSVRIRPDVSWSGLFRSYLRSILTMFIVAPLFLISTIVSEVLTRIGPTLEEWLGWRFDLGSALYLAIGFVLLTAVFGVIYKWLPDVEIHWRDVLFGAVVTAALFSVGRTLIGWYLAGASTASLFGAAGSLVVLLFWVYYSTQILFYGAELTQVYAEKYGRTIDPSPQAARFDYAGAFED